MANQITMAAQFRSAQTTVEPLVNDIFERLTASCPVLLSTSERQLAVMKKQWILGFAENGITTFELVKRGMAKVRSKPNGFLPSVGEFIAWCKQDRFEALGLPNEDELYQRLIKFQGYGMLEIHKFHHKFNFENDAEYWLLTDLYCNNREATEKELRKAVREALNAMATRLEAGEILPQPQITLPAKPSFIPPEKQREINLKGASNCKAILYGARQ